MPITKTIWQGKVGIRDSVACNVTVVMTSVPVTSIYCKTSTRQSKQGRAVHCTAARKKKLVAREKVIISHAKETHHEGTTSVSMTLWVGIVSALGGSFQVDFIYGKVSGHNHFTPLSLWSPGDPWKPMSEPIPFFSPKMWPKLILRK